jgi:hypothetical protein
MSNDNQLGMQPPPSVETPSSKVSTWGPSENLIVLPKEPTVSAAVGESLDDLIADAEAPHDTQHVCPLCNHSDHSAPTDASPCDCVCHNRVTDCSHEGTTPTEREHCVTCHRLMCSMCWSILDPRYCKQCLNEPDAELRELPLLDAEGHRVEHGRVLTPAPTAKFFQPRFGTLCKTISEMSDTDLHDYVKQYAELVRQAEKALDFRRVVLASAQIETTQRASAKQRKLRSEKTKYPVHTVVVNKSGKPVTKTASAADLTNMMKALEALTKLRQLKDAQAKAAAVDAKMKEPKL